MLRCGVMQGFLPQCSKIFVYIVIRAIPRRRGGALFPTRSSGTFAVEGTFVGRDGFTRTRMTAHSPPRILVVEDEPLIRMIAVDMLDMLGFEVVEASTGGEALAIPVDELQGITALMIDLGLPDQPGEDVVRGLLQKRPDLPVIVTTGTDATQAISRVGAEHVVTVLEKPYQLKDLERTVAPYAEAR
jgi:CheY-like chemotaxis protein